ncbi:MAG: hypothetical protein JWN18_373 [Parcubacteria group bacterium]|nr:hypothetical protein [Parcubacteria group bacterium]
MDINWYLVLAVLSGVLSLISGFVYIKDVLKGGGARPNTVSFTLWAVLQWIAFFAQLSSGASLSIVIVFFIALNMTAVVILSLFGYGYKHYGKIELYCVVLAILAIIGWQITSNPLVAILCAIAGDLFAFIPTFIKTYHDPKSESAPSWGLVALASLFGVLSTTKLDAPNIAFPLYLLLSNGAIFVFAYVGQRSKRA